MCCYAMCTEGDTTAAVRFHMSSDTETFKCKWVLPNAARVAHHGARAEDVLA